MAGAARRLLQMATLFTALVWEGLGQLRVLSPRELIRSMPGGDGKVDGSTATFGAPFFGDRVMGRIVWSPSRGGNYCSADDYDVTKATTGNGALRGTSETEGADGQLIDIVVVRRGDCSFTSKVRVAQEKGAHAVIIVDREDSPLTQEDMPRIVVASDGHETGISIPSILIPNEEGGRIISEAKVGPVVAELKWNLPANHVVQMDLWMSSGSRESQQFLTDFAPMRRVLNHVVRFRPHYAVFGMPVPDPKLCLDNAGEYCAEDPDGEGPVYGRDVLEENVRQLCIHELTKIPMSSISNSGSQVAEYAQKFWDYIEHFATSCPLGGASPSSRFGTDCSESVMSSVGLDVNQVRQCARTTRDAKLKSERTNVAWSPRALRINGWRYTGMMNADLVTRAVCSGFISQPKECQELLKPRDPLAMYGGEAVLQSGGVSLGSLLMVLALGAVITAIAAIFYRRALKLQVHRAIREEVMLEVQSQMASYTKMPADL